MKSSVLASIRAYAVPRQMRYADDSNLRAVQPKRTRDSDGPPIDIRRRVCPVGLCRDGELGPDMCTCRLSEEVGACTH
jgi:hypothetical protein